MHNISKVFVFLFILTIGNNLFALEIKGRIIKVNGLDVTVQVDGELLPSTGDTMKISFTLPDGESLSIGTWQITGVTGSIANASVKENTGNPVAGHRAVIFSDNPVPLSKIIKPEPRETSVYTPPQQDTGMDETQKVIEQMRSSNPVQKRDGAKIAFKKFSGNPDITAAAAEELEKGYSINHHDRYHVDAMAWLCNILGASYDKKFAPLLRKVYKESGSDKISEYAKKNYKILR